MLYRILYGCAFRDSFLDGLLCTGVLSDLRSVNASNPVASSKTKRFSERITGFVYVVKGN
ncbi:hypothetical protein BWI97_19705 [Siphonobacter sp. BAB-5405]|nr:hypothetical protein BWI97_19705 [Siphonobacter sp. BAB-5405]